MNTFQFTRRINANVIVVECAYVEETDLWRVVGCLNGVINVVLETDNVWSSARDIVDDIEGAL